MFVGPASSRTLFANSRPIFGVDGAHTKSLVRQTLLLARLLDTNRSIQVLAFAVVSIEDEDNWTWFLENLGDLIPELSDDKVVVMSDRDKGLIQAVDSVFPMMNHSYCCVHLAANISSKQGAGGKNSGKKIWKLEKAQSEDEFE